MSKKNTQKIIKNLQENYSSFAEEFSETRKYAWPEFTWIKKYINKEEKILDLGCGNGRLYETLKDLHLDYTGVDFCEPLLKIAQKKHPKTTFLNHDITSFNIPKKEFDKIISIAALHHIPSKKLRKKVLKHISHGLRDNGLLIVSTWNLWQKKYAKQIIQAIIRSISSLGLFAWNDLFIPWKGTQKNKKLKKRYYHAFTKGELIKLLNNTGFKIVDEFKATNKKSHNYTFVCKKKMVKAVSQPVFEVANKAFRSEGSMTPPCGASRSVAENTAKKFSLESKVEL